VYGGNLWELDAAARHRQPLIRLIHFFSLLLNKTNIYSFIFTRIQNLVHGFMEGEHVLFNVELKILLVMVGLSTMWPVRVV